MICAGNLCRSPFAAAYMQKRLTDASVDIEVYSRGLIALPGARPPLSAINAVKAHDINLTEHIAQPALGPDLDRAGIILVMETSHRQHIGKIKPAGIGKVFLLSHASRPPLTDTPIDDPMGKDEDCFQTVYELITQHADAWLQRFGIR